MESLSKSDASTRNVSELYDCMLLEAFAFDLESCVCLNTPKTYLLAYRKKLDLCRLSILPIEDIEHPSTEVKDTTVWGEEAWFTVTVLRFYNVHRREVCIQLAEWHTCSVYTYICGSENKSGNVACRFYLQVEISKNDVSFRAWGCMWNHDRMPDRNQTTIWLTWSGCNFSRRFWGIKSSSWSCSKTFRAG